MKPNFPLTNVGLSSLDDLLDRSFVWDFYERLTEEETFGGNDFVQFKIDHARDTLKMMEGEIYQTIHSASRFLIISHFAYIKEQRANFASWDIHSVVRLLKKYNKEFTEEFDNEIEGKYQEHIKKEEHRNLLPYQTYEKSVFMGFLVPILSPLLRH